MKLTTKGQKVLFQLHSKCFGELINPSYASEQTVSSGLLRDNEPLLSSNGISFPAFCCKTQSVLWVNIMEDIMPDHLTKNYLINLLVCVKEEEISGNNESEYTIYNHIG